MNVSTALRTARLWLRARLHREQRTDWVEYSKQIAWRRTPRLLPPPQAPARPSTYEPPQKTPFVRPSTDEQTQRTTDPAQQVHRLAETGRIASMIRTQKLPSVKLRKTHFYKLVQDSVPEQAGPICDPFLGDEPEDADATSKAIAIVRLKHESRGKAS